MKSKAKNTKPSESKKTKEELDRDILLITTRIQQEFPELMKYLEEMPAKYSETTDEGVERDNLEDYLNSLKELLTSYAKDH